MQDMRHRLEQRVSCEIYERFSSQTTAPGLARFEQTSKQAVLDYDFWLRGYDKPRDWVLEHVWTQGNRKTIFVKPDDMPTEWMVDLETCSHQSSQFESRCTGRRRRCYCCYRSQFDKDQSISDYQESVKKLIDEYHSQKIECDWRAKTLKLLWQRVPDKMGKKIWMLKDKHLKGIKPAPKQALSRPSCVKQPTYYYTEDLRRLAYRTYGGPAGFDAYVVMSDEKKQQDADARAARKKRIADDYEPEAAADYRAREGYSKRARKA